MINLDQQSGVNYQGLNECVPQSVESKEQKIIVLEGLDGCGKSALAKQLEQDLGPQALRIHLQFDKSLEADKKAFFEKGNVEVFEIIKQSKHRFIILDRSWLSGEVSRCGAEGGLVKDWPNNLYRPTHLFLLTLPENERLKHMRFKEKDVPPTAAEKLLENDAVYRERCISAYLESMNRLKTKTLCKVFDGSNISIQEMSRKIQELLKVDLSLLDPRKLTTSNKLILRDRYVSWQQRVKEGVLAGSDYIKLVSNPSLAPQFDAETRMKHQCHFENIDKVFSYDGFSQPRHPPLPIGYLEDKNSFDLPFQGDIAQAQDMPISFPAESPDAYEYRIPKAYAKLKEVVQKVADVWHSLSSKAHKYYAYLSVSHGIIDPWVAQRRPSIHCDGFQSARVEPKEPGEYAFVVGNALPTVYYVESFNVQGLNPAKDDFFVAYSQNSSTPPLECQKPYQIMMMDPYCLHAAVINTTDAPVTRTFVRIQYSTRIYDRIGNTHNPCFNYAWEMVRREAQLDLMDKKNKQ